MGEPLAALELERPELVNHEQAGRAGGMRGKLGEVAVHPREGARVEAPAEPRRAVVAARRLREPHALARGQQDVVDAVLYQGTTAFGLAVPAPGRHDAV